MIDAAHQKLLFSEARTYSTWQDKAVDPAILRQIYDLMKFGPTSANCSPLRIVFVTSQAAKDKLKPCLAEGNVEKTMSAPVTAILASDQEFYEKLPQLFPHTDAKSWFTGNPEMIKETAFRNSALQGAYFILAARGFGLDCGPMSGFDADAVNRSFFGTHNYRVNFLCNLGYGDKSSLFPRSPRLDFEESCQII